ncbi:hypothetical protein KA977_15625 [Candidatus Dependentiae bacterium]|nr:hypothetical protein [Candidatus Dependentiae bacterium]
MNNQLLNFIPVGKANARKTKTLALLLNIPYNSNSDRNIRKAIEELKAEYPICATSNGYYIPLNSEEAAEYFATQYKHIRTLSANLKKISANLNKKFNLQLELEI